MDHSQQAIQCNAQGFSQAKLAWKKKNAIPQTNKEAKAQRPTGRGDGGARGGRAAPNRGGGRAPMGGCPYLLFISTSFLLCSSSNAISVSFLVYTDECMVEPSAD